MRVRRFALGLAIVAAAISGIALVEGLLQLHGLRRMSQEARARLHPFLQVVPSGEMLDHINSQGFRGDPLEIAKPSGVFRVFALGGSTTLSVRTDYAATYPAGLQERLRARYPGVTIEVQNAASDWYTTAHSLINYELRVRAFEPDLVVVFHGINDMCRSFSPSWWASGAYRPDYSHYLGPLMRMRGLEAGFIDPAGDNPFANLLLWREVKELLGTPSPYDLTPEGIARLRRVLRPIEIREDFRSLPQYRENLALLSRSVRADDAVLLIASQPFLYSDTLTEAEQRTLFFGPVFCAEDGAYPNDASMRRGLERFNAAARDVAAQAGVPFLDFEAVVPKSAVYFTDDVHMTEAANEVLAEEVFRFIVEQELVETRVRVTSSSTEARPDR